MGFVVVAVIAVVFVWNSSGGNGVDPARCLSVPGWLLAELEAGLTVQGIGTLGDASAVLSEDVDDLYFIAAQIGGPGTDDSVGVWATNRLGSEPEGAVVLAVNSLAQEFSVYPDAGSADSSITMSDDGAREATECLEL